MSSPPTQQEYDVMSPQNRPPQARVDVVDVRGPRFTAWVTSAVLVITLLVSAVSGTTAAVLLTLQAVVFAVGTLGGPRRHPYGLVYGRLVAPRLTPVTEREPVAPLRFAQLVGLVFAAAGAASFFAGWTVAGVTAAALALFAALLNAAFGICLGCRLYPLAVRLKALRTPTPA
jgi:Domain of unknown function (DUF4395)